MCDVDYLSIADVQDPKTLARYISQRTGVPYPNNSEMMILRKKVKDFFVQHPHLNYSTLCRVADWSVRKRRRFGNAWRVVEAWKWAYEQGAIPEVDEQRHADPKTDRAICEVLAIEKDPAWRLRFQGTQDRRIRRELLKKWTQTRQPQLLMRAG